jgi:ATP-dependent DNA helicase RecG
MKCSWLRSIFRWINLSILALRYASPWVFHRRNFFSRLETNVHHDVSDPVSIIQDGDRFTFTPRSWKNTVLSSSASNQPHLLTDLQNQTLTAQKCIALLKQLEMPVSSLPGVGPRTEEALHRLGLFNVRSLLFHFPTSFIDRSSLCKDINNVPDGELCTVVVTVEFIVRNPQYIRAKCRDPSGNTLFIRWFHGSSARGKNFAIAISKTLGNLPSRRIISGRLKWNDNHTVAEIINPQLVKKVDEIKAVQRIEPIYKLTEGLTQSKMIQTIDYAIQIGSALLREIPEFLPEELLLQLSWPTLADSLILAHSPSTVVSLKRGRASAAMTPARLRLAFQEFITQQVFLEITRWRYKNTFYFPKSTLSDSSGRIVFQQIVSTWEESPLIQMALQSLPYSLTQSQKRCLGELWKDALGYTGGMSRMARLLHGDVGSGKTVGK